MEESLPTVFFDDDHPYLCMSGPEATRTVSRDRMSRVARLTGSSGFRRQPEMSDRLQEAKKIIDMKS